MEKGLFVFLLGLVVWLSVWVEILRVIGRAKITNIFLLQVQGSGGAST
jgi:hypothetical protein